MAERIDYDDVWQFPQGGIEAGESPEDALWRELGEELGLANPRQTCSIVGRSKPTRYDYPVDAPWEHAKRWRGQEQVMFLLEFTGDDRDFDLDAFYEPEFKSVRWCSLSEARELIWPIKSGLLEALVSAMPEAFS